LTRLRAAIALLLVGSGLLFAIGSTIERHQHHAEHPATAAHAPGENGQGGESGGNQLNESNSGVATIAAILIGLHLAVTGLAEALYPRQSTVNSGAVAEPRV